MKRKPDWAGKTIERIERNAGSIGEEARKHVRANLRAAERRGFDRAVSLLRDSGGQDAEAAKWLEKQKS